MSYNVPIDATSYIKGFSDACMNMKNNGYVNVVRCGVCKWYEGKWGCSHLDMVRSDMESWFCADGEKEEENNGPLQF